MLAKGLSLQDVYEHLWSGRAGERPRSRPRAPLAPRSSLLFPSSCPIP